MKNKNLILLIIMLMLALPAAAVETGFYFAFLTSGKLMVFTPDYLAPREPQPDLSDLMLTVAAQEPGNYEFNVFAQFISGRNLYIDNGFYDTSKVNLGFSMGKVMSIPLLIPGTEIDGKLDISAGPFISFYLTNNYTFLSGENKKEVSSHFGHRFQYGLYSSVKLQALYLQRFFRHVVFNLGLSFYLPLSNHEFNSDEKARFHLFRTFFFAGVSF